MSTPQPWTDEELGWARELTESLVAAYSEWLHGFPEGQRPDVRVGMLALAWVAGGLLAGPSVKPEGRAELLAWLTRAVAKHLEEIGRMRAH